MILFVITFAIGVGSGVFAHKTLAKSPSRPTWNETEEDTRRRMYEFQQRLDQLEKQSTPDSTDKLAKEMEQQRGIDDILIKYRETQQSKFSPFYGPIGAVAVATITGLFGWLLGRRKSKISLDEAKREGAATA